MDDRIGWTMLWGFYDPPPAPEGYDTEYELCILFGYPIAYRYVPNVDKLAQAKVEGRA